MINITTNFDEYYEKEFSRMIQTNITIDNVNIIIGKGTKTLNPEKSKHEYMCNLTTIWIKYDSCWYKCQRNLSLCQIVSFLRNASDKDDLFEKLFTLI